MFAATRSFLLAIVCIYWLFEGETYPAFGAARVYSWAWVWPIVLRWELGTWLIAGGWDYFLHFSPVADKLAKFKLNPARPTMRQIMHDACVTTVASLTGAAIECWCCHAWATGAVAFDRNLTDRPLFTAIAAVTITHWRVPHFWVMHRAMHPWRPAAVGLDWMPDVGRFLYRHVHSLHHKSHNPTAFSGTSMHPVESTAYYSAALMAMPFGCHPAIVVGCLIDCAVGAWLGHDGFQWPGSGDYFHQLHHHHFDCNYGAMHVPIDLWLGTFAASKDDLKKLWGRQEAVGMAANEKEAKVHAPAAPAM